MFFQLKDKYPVFHFLGLDGKIFESDLAEN